MVWLSDGNLPLDAMVGIETDDDLAIRIAGVTRIREQDKHALDRPPFTDGSENLWKTLLIWNEDAANNRLNLDNICLLMVTNQQLQDDSLARTIGQADSEAELDLCIKRVKTFADYAQQNQLQVLPQIKQLLGTTDVIIRKLFRAIKCCDARDATVSVALRQKIANQLQMLADDPQDSILDELSGWVQRQVQELIRARKPAWIKREPFLRQYWSIQVSKRRERRRERAEALIPVTDAQRSEKRGRNFVRQLELIDVAGDDQIMAINDIIRCNSERHRLTEEGDITASDWVRFDNNIYKNWENQKRRVGLSIETRSDEQKGKTVYFHCLEHREPLAGEQTDEYYLTRGTYHRHADAPDDEPMIGWHPRYRELLKVSGSK